MTENDRPEMTNKPEKETEKKQSKAKERARLERSSKELANRMKKPSEMSDNIRCCIAPVETRKIRWEKK